MSFPANTFDSRIQARGADIVGIAPVTEQSLQKQAEYIDTLTEVRLLEAAPRLEAEFIDYWRATNKVLDLTDKPDESDNYLANLEKEFSFYRKVMTAVLTMARRQPGPVTLLFDVDFTLVHSGELARPAAGIVVEDLHKMLGDQLEVGLLSTRRQDSLTDQLADPTYMSGMIDRVNPNFLISSSAAERIDPSLYRLSPRGNSYDDTASKIELTKDVVDPYIIEAAKHGDYENDLWYDTKLVILKRLAEANPERTFVWVDDIPAADAVDPSHPQIAGVNVFDEKLPVKYLD